MRALPPFEAVLEAHGADVWRFAASQVGQQRADDVYQDTMLAALAAYPQLRDLSVVRSWLLRIAARKSIDAHRAAGRDPIPVATVDRGTTAELEQPDDALWEQVRALPAKQRHAIALRFVLDLAYAEIGEAMETSAEAARRNVFEGLRVLRTTIDLGPQRQPGGRQAAGAMR